MNSQIISQNPNLVTRDIDGEVVIMIPAKGKVLALNEVGSFIWNRINGSNSIEDILNAVCHEFDVNREQAAVDVDDFITLLYDKNLLVKEVGL